MFATGDAIVGAAYEAGSGAGSYDAMADEAIVIGAGADSIGAAGESDCLIPLVQLSRREREKGGSGVRRESRERCGSEG
eukprot:12901365-Prorocentrum_lima.AAC.1